VNVLSRIWSGIVPGDTYAPDSGHLGRRLAAAAVALVLGAGCGDEVVVPDTPIEVVSVDEVIGEGLQITIDYTLRDAEADDAEILVVICESDADGQELVACGFPSQGTGGDGTLRVPTAPRGEEIPHRFRWDFCAGRIRDARRVATELDTLYIARISVVGGPGAGTSAPFTLGDDLGYTSLPCGE
jgi:hypothetical protein